MGVSRQRRAAVSGIAFASGKSSFILEVSKLAALAESQLPRLEAAAPCQRNDQQNKSSCAAALTLLHCPQLPVRPVAHPIPFHSVLCTPLFCIEITVD